jgi:flagellar L-ring protein precursor FlgH
MPTVPHREPHAGPTRLVPPLPALLLVPALLGVTAPRAAAQAAAAPAATAQAANGAAAQPARPARESWVADRRTFAVGDIITVLVDDYTISTAIKDNIATDRRDRNMGATARLPEQSRTIGLDVRNDASQQQRGQMRRENRFQNEMSVRVVAVGPTGLLQVRGTKLINVDKAKQDIVLTGWVRAQDVSPQNLVESYRIADAQLTYNSPGPLGKPKQGIVSRVLGWFWP